MKRIAFISLFLFSLIFSNAVFAQNHAWYDVTFQIINADTFEVIAEGSLSTSQRVYQNEIKTDIRSQLGFSSDTRTVGDVTQRIIWVSIERRPN